MSSDGDNDGPTEPTSFLRVSRSVAGWVRLVVSPDVALTVDGMVPHPEHDVDLLFTTLSVDGYAADNICSTCGSDTAFLRTVGISTPFEVLGLESYVECLNGHQLDGE